MLTACKEKRKAEVLFHNMFTGQGRLISNTKRVTEWVSGNTIEVKLTKCYDKQ